MNARALAAAATFLAALALGPAAPAAQLEGLYTVERQGTATVRIRASSGPFDFVAVVVDGSNAWHRKLLTRTVLTLKKAGPDAYTGRYNACHLHLSDDTAAWGDLLSARQLGNGDLVCRIASGGAQFQVTYQRQKHDGPALDLPGAAGDLAGRWRDRRTGRITYVLRHRDTYLEQIVKLAPSDRALGFRVGEETARLQKTGANTYKGEAKRKSKRGQRTWWEPIEIAVKATSFAYTRRAEGGARVTGSAVRLDAYDATDGQPDPEQQGHELLGLWRDNHGGITRYERRGDVFVGRVVRISDYSRGFGFRIGEESIRLTRIAEGLYKGKVKVRTAAGRSTWWEDVKITIRGKTYSFVRYQLSGKRATGSSVKLPEPRVPQEPGPHKERLAPPR